MGRKRLRKWPWVNTLCRQSRTCPPPFRTSCKSSTCSCWLSCNTLPAPWNPWRCPACCTAFSQTRPRLRSRDPAATVCPGQRSAVKSGERHSSGEYNRRSYQTRMRNYFRTAISHRIATSFHIVTALCRQIESERSFKRTYFVISFYFYYIYTNIWNYPKE